MVLPRTRLDIPCSPGHECSDEEISSIAEEIYDIRQDRQIKKYKFPTLEEMEAILATAETYTGNWYHSNVTIKAEDYLADEDKSNPLYMEAYNKFVSEDLREKGVSVSTWYDIDIPWLSDIPQHNDQ